MLPLWTLPIGVGGAVLLFFYGYVVRRGATMTLQFALQAGLAPANARLPQPTKGLVAQLVHLGRKYAPFAERFPQLRELLLPIDIDQRLAWAGNPLGIVSREFLGVQLVFMGLTGLGGLLGGDAMVWCLSIVPGNRRIGSVGWRPSVGTLVRAIGHSSTTGANTHVARCD